MALSIRKRTAKSPTTLSKTKIVLLLGFEPFGGEANNPSWQAVSQLGGEIIGKTRVVAAQLPTVFGAARAEVHRLMNQYHPDLVIGVGLAGGRTRLSIERVAINVIDARIPDNAGQQPIDCAVIDHAPSAYFSTLPIKSIVAAWQAAQLPCEVSNTAGTFVCNEVFFGLSHLIATVYPTVKAGFVHIPFSPEQAVQHANAPSLPIDLVCEALRIAVKESLSPKARAGLTAGTLH